MPLRTTTIGAFPKPSYLNTPDWFGFESTIGSDATLATNRGPVDPTEILDRATVDVVKAQVRLGIDVPTDGEVRRENYVHYHCRHWDGIDFGRLTRRSLRDGAWIGDVPTFTGPIEVRDHFLPRDWAVAQSASDRPVKVTVPGPLTVMDSTADDHYGDERRWGAALAAALNHEVRAVAEAGCRVIQVDEPVFARYPDRALEYGLDLVEQVFAGLPTGVERVLHMCCGYPDRLDSEEYEKADPATYLQLAPSLDESSIDTVSLEDAHQSNPGALFETFAETTVVLGVVEIAASRIESVGEIRQRVEEVLRYLPPEQLMLAPDCGLGMLPESIALAKLTNLVEAAATV